LRLALALLIAAIAAAALAAAVLLLPGLIDGDTVRARVAQQAEALVGQPVVIEGAVDLRLTPRPHLTVARLRVPGPEHDLALVDRLDLQLAVLPLLIGRLEVVEASLVRPSLHVPRLDDGRLLWPRPADGAEPLREQRLEQVHILDGQLTVDGTRPERAMRLRDIYLDLGAASSMGPFVLTGHLAVESQRFDLRVDLGRLDDRGGGTLRLTATTETGLIPGELGYRGLVRLAGMDSSLRGEVSVTGGDLGALAALAAELTGHPPPQLPPWLAGAGGARARVELDRRRLLLGEARLDLAGATLQARLDLDLGDGPRAEASLQAERLALEGGADTVGRSLASLVDLVPSWPGRLELALGQVDWGGDSLRRVQALLRQEDGVLVVESATAMLPGATDLTLAGRIDAGTRRLEGDLGLGTDDLRRLLAWLGVEADSVPGDRLRTMTLTGQLTLAPDRLNIHRADLRIDGSHMEGSMAMALGERIRIALAARLNRLTLDAYLPEAPPLELAALAELTAGLDAAVDLTVDRLAWRGLGLDGMRLRGELDHGVVTIQELSASDVAEASGEIVGSLDLAAEAFDLALALQTERPTRVLRVLGLDLPPAAVRFAPLRINAIARGSRAGADVELELHAADTRASLAGQLAGSLEAPRYDLAVRIEQSTLGGFLHQLGVLGLDDEPLEGPLRLDGTIRGGPRQPVAARIGAVLGPMQGDAAIRLERGERRPMLDLRLVADPLDLRVVEAIGAVVEPWVTLPSAPAAWLGYWPRTPLDWGWLDEIDLVLEIGARELRTGAGRLGAFALEARLDDRRLTLERLLADLSPGELRLAGRLDGREGAPRLRLDVALSERDAADLLELLGVPPMIEGATELRAELATTGLSPYDLIGGLAGTVDLRVRDGRLHGLDLAGVARALADGPETPVERVAAALGDGASPFALLGGPFRVERGVLAGDELLLVMDGAEGRIAGTIDLLAWVADLTLTLHPEGGPPSPGFGLHLIGPFDRIRPRPLIDSGSAHPAETDGLVPLPPGRVPPG
jgi:hypothetical protein